MKAGDRVVYVGPSLFKNGTDWVGTVVRMPLPWQKHGSRRMQETRVMVQKSGEVRHNGQPPLRPVRPQHLKLQNSKA